MRRDGGAATTVGDHRGRPGRSWEQVLAEIANHVESVAVGLSDDLPLEPSAWSPPDELGPAPGNLRDRLELLTARVAEARTAARGELDRLAGELEALDRRRTAGAAYQRNDRTA